VSRDNPTDCEAELELVDCKTTVGEDEDLQTLQQTSEGTDTGTGQVSSMGGAMGT